MEKLIKRINRIYEELKKIESEKEKKIEELNNRIKSLDLPEEIKKKIKNMLLSEIENYYKEDLEKIKKKINNLVYKLTLKIWFNLKNELRRNR